MRAGRELADRPDAGHERVELAEQGGHGFVGPERPRRQLVPLVQLAQQSMHAHPGAVRGGLRQLDQHVRHAGHGRHDRDDAIRALAAHERGAAPNCVRIGQR